MSTEPEDRAARLIGDLEREISRVDDPSAPAAVNTPPAAMAGETADQRIERLTAFLDGLMLKKRRHEGGSVHPDRS